MVKVGETVGFCLGDGKCHSVGARDGPRLGAPIILIIVCHVIFKKGPGMCAIKGRVVGADVGDVIGKTRGIWGGSS